MKHTCIFELTWESVKTQQQATRSCFCPIARRGSRSYQRSYLKEPRSLLTLLTSNCNSLHFQPLFLTTRQYCIYDIIAMFTITLIWTVWIWSKDVCSLSSDSNIHMREKSTNVTIECQINIPLSLIQYPVGVNIVPFKHKLFSLANNNIKQ
jgi:hypothetical protein